MCSGRTVRRDGPAGGVTGVAAGSNTSLPVSGGVGTGIAGTFGTLTLNADGSYSYDGTPNVVPPAGATDTFVYTITDGDGDTSTMTLTITLTDSGLAAVERRLTVNEAALATGSNPSSTAETVTGTVVDNVTPRRRVRSPIALVRQPDRHARHADVQCGRQLQLHADVAVRHHARSTTAPTRRTTSRPSPTR